MKRRRIVVDSFSYAVYHVNIREMVPGYSLLIQNLMNLGRIQTISPLFYANMKPKSIKYILVQELKDD